LFHRSIPSIRVAVGGRCFTSLMVAAAGYEIAPGVTRVFEPAEVTELEGLIIQLGRIGGSVGEHAFDVDAVRVDQIDLLERLKAAAEAAQARVIVAFERSQLERQ
jgi:hypothetical protein